MGREQRAATLDERLHHCPRGGGRRHGGHAAQHERVVGDEQLGYRARCLADHLKGGVNGKVNLVTCREGSPTASPGVSQPSASEGWKEPLQHGDDVGHIAAPPRSSYSLGGPYRTRTDDTCGVNAVL